MRSQARNGLVLGTLILSLGAGASASASTPAKGEDAGSGAQATEVFVRDTPDGIRVRVHDAAASSAIGPQVVWPGGATYMPTPGPGPISLVCQSDSSLLVGLSTDAAVGQGFGNLLRPSTKPALLFVGSGGFGVAQGEPVVWVALQTSKKVASVRAKFAGGGRDDMEPIDGIAVLASEDWVDESAERSEGSRI